MFVNSSPVLDISAYADCSSDENIATSEKMLWHDPWLELQGGVLFEG